MRIPMSPLVSRHSKVGSTLWRPRLKRKWRRGMQRRVKRWREVVRKRRMRMRRWKGRSGDERRFSVLSSLTCFFVFVLFFLFFEIKVEGKGEKENELGRIKKYF